MTCRQCQRRTTYKLLMHLLPGPSKMQHQQRHRSKETHADTHNSPECPMLLFPLRNDLSGYGAYPFAAHKKFELLWTPVFKRVSKVQGEEPQDVLYLRSNKCTWKAHPFREGPDACQECQDVTKHTSFDGIVTRANDGCKESHLTIGSQQTNPPSFSDTSRISS